MRATVIKLVDDMGARGRARTIHFSVDGSHFEIDLTERSIRTLRRALAPFILRARRMQRAPGPRDLVPAHDPASVREWADRRGIQRPRRGFPGRALVDRFNAEHGVPSG
jgi:hypothetical protein